MKITCDSCGAKYTIADDKVRGRKVKIRCKGCGTPIVVDGQQETASTPPADAGEAATTEASTSEPAPAGVSEAPAARAEWSVNLSETDQRTLSTQQIVDGWRNGTIGADAFVWKEGMGDWLPVQECPELVPLLAAPKKPTSAPKAAVAQRTASTRPARVSGGRGQAGTDLFAGVDTAGSDDEVDVAVTTSAAAGVLPQAGSRADEQKPTGARNENSVLFSLDALKAGFGGTSASSTSAPARPEPKRGSAAARSAAAAVPDDPFGLSSGGRGAAGPMFSLADNSALLTAPAPPPEPPKAVAAFSPNYTGPEPKSSKKLVIAVAAVAAVLIAGIGGFALAAQKDKEEAIAAAAAAAAAESKAREEEKKAKERAEQVAREKEAEEQRTKEARALAESAKAAEPAAAAAGDAAAKPAAAAATPGKPGTAAPKKEEKKEEPVAAASDQPFSKAAAVSALGSAAGSAGSCKKLGGPTGAGKVTVTFANSGRVTTANVNGAPFAGTSVGGCVASIFRKAKVPPFSGSPVTVSKSFSIN